MPQERQKILGELALTALKGELGEPKTFSREQTRRFLWMRQRGDRPMLTVHLLLEPNGGSYPVRLVIGDPCRAEGEGLSVVTVEAAAEIHGVVVDIRRRMVGA